MDIKTVYMLSLGCDKNTVDAQFILGDLVSAGLSVTDNIEDADLVIVNTCSFIEEARKESIEAIFDCINQKKEEATIIVTGCLAQQYKDELIEEIPEIDGFFKLNEQNEILNFLNLKQNSLPNRYISGQPTAYLKISEGCNRNCTYCSIPLIRGKHKSILPEILFKQAQTLEDNGVKELILVAQDLTQYGTDLDNNINFNYLLNELASRFNFKWIRLLYLYPEGINNELIQIIKSHSNIIPYFDIPIQHTVDRILKKMNRFITKDQIKDLVKKLREEFNNSVIRSTVIVGFPTETEEEFEELKRDLQELKFDRLGAFSYSREEKTKAYEMQPQINENIKIKRVNEINQIQNELMSQRNQEFINNTYDCLIEEEIDKNNYIGRIYSDAPDIDSITYINSSKELAVGTFVPVKIRETLNYDLLGDLDEFAK